MRKSESNQKLIDTLIQTLKRSIPPKKESNHLNDLVILLMDALSKGEVYIDINKTYSHLKMKGKGWPKMHLKALQASGWIGEENSPMILKNDQLSWRRWHEEMTYILNLLSEKALFRTKYNLSNNFNGIDNHENILLRLNSQQMLAVNAVANHNLILISGGPGTGKTTTIVSMLVKAFSLKNNLKVGLSAPTGKASRRLEETLKSSLADLNSKYKHKLSKIPCLTIHSWLQANDEGFIKGKENQLKLDLLVVDEMSMVDFSLMEGLLNALHPKSQLILVGDPDQLPPIGIGPIWNELQKTNHASKFKHCSIHLSETYRTKGEIASLSEMVKSNELHTFFEELESLKPSEKITVLYSKKEVIPNQVIEAIKNQQEKLKYLINSLKSFTNPEHIVLDSTKATNAAEEILNCLERLIILCPKRYGFWSLNHIHKTVLGDEFEVGVSKWPEGTPVICCSNQSNIKLANGDIGIIIQGSNCKYLLFRVNSVGESGNCQLINPVRVKAIEPAFSITIHKSQGSEAEHVMCLWPEQSIKQFPMEAEISEDESYKKKLIYTAITRAKVKLDLVISIENQI